MTHHVGLILVDEIQNVISTAQKNHQTKPLIKFLVELTNDTCTSVYFIGTPGVEEVFTSQEHLKRRTRGIRLLPLKPDGTYRTFLSTLWPYQLTPGQAPMTDKMVNKLFDYSGGIPAYIVKIFQESQARALLMGRTRIDEKIVQQTVDTLAIKVPKTYSDGTYLSDFQVAVNTQKAEMSIVEPLPDNLESEMESPKLAIPNGEKEVPRLYANKRGRKTVRRDEQDLLTAFKDSNDFLQTLREFGLLEVMQ